MQQNGVVFTYVNGKRPSYAEMGAAVCDDYKETKVACGVREITRLLVECGRQVVATHCNIMNDANGGDIGPSAGALGLRDDQR